MQYGGIGLAESQNEFSRNNKAKSVRHFPSQGTHSLFAEKHYVRRSAFKRDNISRWLLIKWMDEWPLIPKHRLRFWLPHMTLFKKLQER